MIFKGLAPLRKLQKWIDMSYIRLAFSRRGREGVLNLLLEKFQEMLGLLRGEIF